jgi:hypothetical protein
LKRIAELSIPGCRPSVEKPVILPIIIVGNHRN